MSGFDPDWLDLREPADHAARSGDVLEAVVAAFASRDGVSVADLAAGSGSTLRALAPRLGPRQRWTLIDHDPALLAHARARLSGWADEIDNGGDVVILRRGAATIEVATVLADLARDPLPEAAASADLVTASALFDLVGADWLARFASKLSASRRPLYAALTVDGRQGFEPAHALDADVMAAFDRDMARDKGFGPALGSSAPAALAAALESAGYACIAGESDWRLGGAYELTRVYAEGVARAVEGKVDGVGDWLAFRLASGGETLVGHKDLFAAPR